MRIYEYSKNDAFIRNTENKFASYLIVHLETEHVDSSSRFLPREDGIERTATHARSESPNGRRSQNVNYQTNMISLGHRAIGRKIIQWTTITVARK